MSSKSGRLSAETWPDRGGEKGGEGDGDDENVYFRLPGPTLIGRGDGGVGGDDEGETFPSFNSSSTCSIKNKNVTKFVNLLFYFDVVFGFW